MQSVVDTVRQDRDEFLLLAFITAVVAYGIAESLTLTRESRLVPLIILGLLVVVLGLTVGAKLFGHRFEIQIFGRSGRFDFDEEMEAGDDDLAGVYDINPRGVLKHFGWLVAYTLALTYVGYWTANLVFGLGYVLIYETSPVRRRIPYAVVSTAIILALLWILLVELLKVQAVFRLGFLP